MIQPRHGRDPRWIAFGARVQALRRARHWRAGDVARAIGRDPATLSQIEHGKRVTGPDRHTLEQLARLFEVSIDTLLDDDHSETPIQETADVPTSPIFPAAATTSRRAVDPAVYDAVCEALYAVLQDLLLALSDANARRTIPTAHVGRQAARPGADAPRRVARR